MLSKVQQLDLFNHKTRTVSVSHKNYDSSESKKKTKLPEPGYKFSSKFTMIRTFWTPLLDDNSKLLIKPDSLVTVSALSFLCFFAPWSPISEFLSGLVQNRLRTCSLSPKQMTVSQNSILQRAAKLMVQVELTCLRFGLIFIASKNLAKNA